MSRWRQYSGLLVFQLSLSVQCYSWKKLIFSISIMDMSLATAGLDWARSVDAAMDQRSQAYQAGPATRPICGSRTEILKQVMKTSGIVGSSNISGTCETGKCDVEDGVAHIHEVRLECVVSLLKAAVAPLSSFIMEALALNHPLTAAIRQQLQLVPSKMVLKNINSMKPTTPFM
ncbi:uncharacterized protein LOC120350757 isoform X2 [Nilaparvata lugens]|uniref:uncharacterized protein LOC120350757 isoform X2 n=1 Tax=Nilaparvata lugens TaxID=108931 RepID=UPI00193D0918|nr:uncharacterized protein LOC120350757 isoform X2 [Nilaparvata lugens]